MAAHDEADAALLVQHCSQPTGDFAEDGAVEIAGFAVVMVRLIRCTGLRGGCVARCGV